MNPSRYVRAALWSTVMVLWSGASLAAALTLPGAKELHAIDVWVAVYSCVVSTLSGGTALAWRINKLLLEYDASGTKFVRPWLFATAHMTGSWLAGTMIFFYGGASSWDMQYLLFSVLVASFGGATVVERGCEKLFGSVSLAPPTTPAVPGSPA